MVELPEMSEMKETKNEIKKIENPNYLFDEKKIRKYQYNAKDFKEISLEFKKSLPDNKICIIGRSLSINFEILKPVSKEDMIKFLPIQALLGMLQTFINDFYHVGIYYNGNVYDYAGNMKDFNDLKQVERIVLLDTFMNEQLSTCNSGDFIKFEQEFNMTEDIEKRIKEKSFQNIDYNIKNHSCQT